MNRTRKLRQIQLILLFGMLLGIPLLASCNTLQSPTPSNPPVALVPFTPTAHATETIQPTATNTVTNTPPAPPTFTSAPTATSLPTKTFTLTHTATRRPTRPPASTPIPTGVPPVLPNFEPAFPQGWHHNVTFTPAQVAPGQSYWRLVSAVFCDVPYPDHPHDKTCPNYPDLVSDHMVYIGVLDENGQCAQNVHVMHVINTGETPPVGTFTHRFPGNPCADNFNWDMWGEASDFWIDGLASDRLNGLLMNSPQLNWSANNAHVRYFLIFQRTTR